MSENNQPQLIDVVLVSKDTSFCARAKSMVNEFHFTIEEVATVDDFIEKYSDTQINFIILSTETANKDEAIGMVQVAKQFAPQGFVLVVVGKKLEASALPWIRKSGADVVIQENEYFESCKLEYFAFHSVRLDYVAIKPGDFIENSQLDFNVYHFMPQNKKYLPVLHKGLKLEEKKLSKMRDSGTDLYLKRKDISKYFKYVSTHSDQSAKGLVSRCRSQFLTLSQSYLELIITLTEQTDKPSYEEGKKILEVCQQLASDLLNSLMTVGQVQNIIGSLQEGDFGSVERAPERAALAGFFSLLSEIGRPEDVMLASLIADIGILKLSPVILKQLRQKKFDTMTSTEKEEYQSHPQKSISYALNRKIQLPNIVKDAIALSHAENNQKGFPQLVPDKILLESQLLLFCEELDNEMAVTMGKPRPIFKDVFNKLLEKHSSFEKYTVKFITSLKKVSASI